MKYCLVRRGVTIQDYSRDSLHRRHRHISSDEVRVLFERGFVEWLSESRGVLRLVERFCSFGLLCTGSPHGLGISWRMQSAAVRDGLLLCRGRCRRGGEGDDEISQSGMGDREKEIRAL